MFPILKHLNVTLLNYLKDEKKYSLLESLKGKVTHSMLFSVYPCIITEQSCPIHVSIDFDK